MNPVFPHDFVPTKMLTTERINAIKTTMEQAILTNGEFVLDNLNLTTQELLKIAFYEPKLTVSVGACGNVCDGTCQTCEHHVEQLSIFFCEKLLEEHDRLWEEEVRAQKEIDELSSQQESEDCCDCFDCNGAHSYELWDYEDDYEDKSDDTSEENFETGLDWNEGGYFD